MTEPFSFQAPQFIEFKPDIEENSYEDSCDEFFGVNIQFDNSVNIYSTPTAIMRDPLSDNNNDLQEKIPMLRKSLSVGNLVLFNEVEQACTSTSNLQINPKSERSRQLKDSKDHLNKLAQPKHYRSNDNLKRGASPFVSMAEAINKYQNGTPPRFRSKPNLVRSGSSQSLNKACGITVAESPALRTKTRTRPMHILTTEQRELLEFEKEQKFKIKARPVNQKILHGPIKPTIPVEKKTTTVPEPFKLTEIVPKQRPPTPKKYEFHAKPIMHSAEKPPQKPVPRKPNTVPVTPSFMKTYKKREPEKPAQEKENPKWAEGRPQVTKPQPFSFDARDKMIEKRRVAYINKVFEEEKRAREFHAKPMPIAIYRATSRSSIDSGSSKKSGTQQQSTEELCPQFKAKPPTVLHKEPFVPVKPEQPIITQIEPFQLTTEVRAQQREFFERQMREKEERKAALTKLAEEKKRNAEEAEIARRRKEAEFKAQPVKKYKEVILQPSNKVTEPISPKFLRRNKENVPSNT